MFRSDLLKLSVTIVLVVATAFVSVAAVAADDSGTIRLVKPARTSAAIGGTPEDWFQRHPSPVTSSDAAVASDWFERHPSSIMASDAAFATDWFERPSASDRYDRHPDSINLGALAGAQMHYGPPGR